jgi:hypothetical protein
MYAGEQNKKLGQKTSKVESKDMLKIRRPGREKS